MKSDMESRDWLNDYKMLKQINPVNPFTVPAGYFDSLEGHIMSQKNLDEIKSQAPEGCFTVPEGYFEELTKNINSRLSIETAINNEGTGFTVPEGYFEELTKNITSRLSIETVIHNEETGFTVPEGYFDRLTVDINSRLSIEEAFAWPEEAFAVPQGYFEKLNKNILDKTVNAHDVKRKGIVRKLFASTAFKYATAACFAVAIGGGILLFNDSSPENAHKNSFLHKQLSTIPISDIKSYLELNVDAGDTQQTMAAEGASVNDADLKDALQNYADSVQ